MQTIYEPKGRAREYAALACNMYSGCDHQCVYCYVRTMPFRKGEFGKSSVKPGFIEDLEKAAARFAVKGVTGQVLLSFTCDPYQALDARHGVTRDAIKILHAHGFSVCVLTKGGIRALRDLDLFGKQDAFAVTLTTLDKGEAALWEPYAAPPDERLRGLYAFHEAGIPTWVSLEPVIAPERAFEIIAEAYPFVDGFKVGKMNHVSSLPMPFRGYVEHVDWGCFGRMAVTLLEKCGYRERATGAADWYYIKDDLKRCMEANHAK